MVAVVFEGAEVWSLPVIRFASLLQIGRIGGKVGGYRFKGVVRTSKQVEVRSAAVRDGAQQ